MSLDKRLLEILCCPISKQPVQLLSVRQLAALNQALGENGLKYADGSALTTPLQAGLITADGKIVYRIDDGIPVMLADQAIDVRGIDGLGG